MPFTSTSDTTAFSGTRNKPLHPKTNLTHRCWSHARRFGGQVEYYHGVRRPIFAKASQTSSAEVIIARTQSRYQLPPHSLLLRFRAPWHRRQELPHPLVQLIAFQQVQPALRRLDLERHIVRFRALGGVPSTSTLHRRQALHRGHRFESIVPLV